MSQVQPARGSFDEIAMVRGASTGFTVLVFGELLTPLAADLDTTLGLFWVSLVGAAGFVVAGTRIGQAARPWLQGAVTALFAFTLTVPLRLFVGVHGDQAWYQLVVSGVFGLVVGAIAGRMAGTVRDHREQES